MGCITDTRYSSLLNKPLKSRFVRKKAELNRSFRTNANSSLFPLNSSLLTLF